MAQNLAKKKSSKNCGGGLVLLVGGYKEKDGGCEIKSIRPIAWSSTKSGFGRGRVLAVVS